MIAGEKLRHPSDALPMDQPAGIARPRTPEGGGPRSLVTTELACALVGGAVLLILAVLLYALGAWLGAGTDTATSGATTGLAGVMAHAEPFAGLFLAGALGTFIAREFAVKPR